MIQTELFGKRRHSKALLSVLLMSVALAACGGGKSAPQDIKQVVASADDPAESGSPQDNPVTGGGGDPGTDSEQPDVTEPDPPAERVGLVVDSTQRCAKVFEPLQVVLTRQLTEGEPPTASGDLPNVTGLVTFEQSYGNSLNLVSRTDESANFEIASQDIVGLTAKVANGSVTIFVAAYDAESPSRFIMRKPVSNGCLYAFKSDDYCSTGLSKAGSLAFARNGVSMTATGCQLDNPDALPVLEIPANSR